MKKNKLLALLLVGALASSILIGCGSTNDNSVDTSGEVTKEETVSKGFTGKKSISVPYDKTGKKLDKVIVEMTFKDGQPEDVSFDTLTVNGEYKHKLADEGQYVMKDGEAKHWGEQVDLLAAFLKENNFDTSKVSLSNDAGNTDVVTGVSIKVPPYLEAVDTLLEEVKSQGESVKAGFSGWLTVETPYDPSGKKPDIVVTDVLFEEGKPVDIKMDVRLEDGTYKRAASEAGTYVMKEGEEKHWHEQVDLLATFLKENNFDTSKVTLSNDAGNTDVVTGVSIKVPAYLEGVNKVLSVVKK